MFICDWGPRIPILIESWGPGSPISYENGDPGSSFLHDTGNYNMAIDPSPRRGLESGIISYY